MPVTTSDISQTTLLPHAMLLAPLPCVTAVSRQRQEPAYNSMGGFLQALLACRTSALPVMLAYEGKRTRPFVGWRLVWP